MYLIQIYVVCSKISQADFYVLRHCLICLCHTLCGKHELISPATNCIAYVLFTHCVSTRGIYVIDIIFNQGIKKLLCSLCINSLNRYTAKTKARDTKARVSKFNELHLLPPVEFCFKDYTTHCTKHKCTLLLVNTGFSFIV